MDDTRPIPGRGRSGDTRPLYNPRSGQTELPTELVEPTDPAHLRQQIRRLADLVDELVAREARRVSAQANEPEPEPFEQRIEQIEARIEQIERWGRTRDLGALVVAAGVVAWTGLCTALAAGAFLWAVT